MGLEAQRAKRIGRWVELLSAAILALATIATAWSAYQSALWGGERSAHLTKASSANVKVAKYANLAQQRLSLHVVLFGQWITAVSAGNAALADFMFNRFPEPLRAATRAWQATQPFTNTSAPATPFDLPEYALAERDEVPRWEALSEAETSAAAKAGEVADHYLLLTIVFASVLFFGGVSGKFRWPPIDLAVLVFGALALAGGLAILFATPLK